MNNNLPTFSSVVWKTTIVHTVTYFLAGLLASTIFDYGAKYADPVVATFMRQTNHPLVAAGPMLQVVRGFLFGIVFYALREITFPRKRGWLTLWLVLGIVGVLSTFGPSPSSIEGVLYTVMPLWFHIIGLPEVIIQTILLAFLTYYWVNHPEKRWLSWVFGIIFVLVIIMSTLGVLSALGLLPQA